MSRCLIGRPARSPQIIRFRPGSQPARRRLAAPAGQDAANANTGGTSRRVFDKSKLSNPVRRAAERIGSAHPLTEGEAGITVNWLLDFLRKVLSGSAGYKYIQKSTCSENADDT